MMSTCPICGRVTCIHWPENWVYRRGNRYYCSEDCLIVEATKDLKLMNEVSRKRRERKNMTRMKKDGTPAKKPGRKPAKTAEEKLEELQEKMAEDGVELVYDPDIAEEYRREQEQKKANEAARMEAEIKERKEPVIFQTSAVRNERLGEFYYDAKYRTIDWRHPAGEEISLPPEEFAELADVIPQILHVLGVEV